MYRAASGGEDAAARVLEDLARELLTHLADGELEQAKPSPKRKRKTTRKKAKRKTTRRKTKKKTAPKKRATRRKAKK